MNLPGHYSNEESHLFNLMMAIPETDAEELLSDNWDHLGYSQNLFVLLYMLEHLSVCSLPKKVLKNVL